MPTPEPTATSPAPRLYRVGSLVYTRRTLAEVMFWMLWGDFFFQMMYALPGSVIPLQLRWAGASDTLIGLLNSSIPAVVSFVLTPIVGVQSDRHRGPLGRRRPFLKWCTPPAALALLLIGVSRPAGGFLHRALALLGAAQVPAAGLTIAWIGLCSVVFIIFNNYAGMVYQYMFADVIPQEMMGRFTGLYRAVGSLGALAFNLWAFGLAGTHTFLLYALVSLPYAGAFTMIAWRVREGEYPPPAPRAAGGGLESVREYCRDCFTHRLYLTYYCITFCFYGTLPALPFVVFFATQAGAPGYAPTLGLSLEAFGRIKGWTFLIQIPAFFLAGPVIDRFHGIRIVMAGMILSSLTYFGCFWFVHGGTSLLIWWSLNQVALAIYATAGMSLAPRLLPREKYGQFLSANATLGWITIIVTPVAWGLVLEAVRDYRYVFLLCGACTAAASVATVLLFLEWRKLGGDRAYAPP